MLSSLLLPLLLAAVFQTPISPVWRAKVAWVPNPRRANSTWVADPARHLQPATVAALNETIGALEREVGAEIAVVVVDSLSGLSAQEFALAIHRSWGVGKSDKDNGIVFLWAPVDRSVFISVGFGLEGVIPDRRAGRIRDEQILAALRQQRFDEGVLAGVRALAAAVREEPNLPQRAARTADSRRSNDRGDGPPIGGIALGVLGLGGAGVGGVLGYRRYQRRKPRNCGNGHPMRLLDDAEEIGQLDKGAQLEQRLGSVDWDVWTCDTCGETHRYGYNKGGKWSECPNCKLRTMTSVRTVVDQPSTVSSGLARITKTCQSCGHKTSKNEIIPMIVVSSSSDSSSGGGGGSDFGGGDAGGGGAGGSY